MSNRVTDQSAFILRRRDWQNTSLILELFTRDHGCLNVLARGARRKPAVQAYQPFSLLNVTWSGRGDLKTLASIEGQALPVDERNYLTLLYVNELIGALLPAGEANPRVFAAYFTLLQDAAGPLDEIDLRRFEIELLRALGYFPDIDADARSAVPIVATASYQFVINVGFVECADSAVDSVKGQSIIDWVHDDYSDESVLRLAKSVLRSTIDFNLHGKRLKSRDVFLQMKRRQ